VATREWVGMTNSEEEKGLLQKDILERFAVQAWKNRGNSIHDIPIGRTKKGNNQRYAE